MEGCVAVVHRTFIITPLLNFPGSESQVLYMEQAPVDTLQFTSVGRHRRYICEKEARGSRCSFGLCNHPSTRCYFIFKVDGTIAADREYIRRRIAKSIRHHVSWR